MFGGGKLVFSDEEKRKLFRGDTRIANIVSSIYDVGKTTIFFNNLSYSEEKLLEKVVQDYDGKLFKH